MRRTLRPLVAHATPAELLQLRVLDPAMGSGAFLVAACGYLASAYEAALVNVGEARPGDVSDADRTGFRRLVAQRCLFGAALNPMAVHLARLSLWLTTLAADAPLTFLDHHLRVGDSQTLKVKGMFRVQLTEDGNVVGDSGWCENMVTNLGFNQYLVRHLGGDTDRKSVTHMAIGTGTAPASDATALPGEITTDAGRIAVSTSSVASHTAQFTAQWASSLHTGTHTIQNLGLFNTPSGGTIFSGNTFAASGTQTRM